jgi:5-methylthioadenosine/S-adenosylhomocysteine deaminase
MKNAALFNKIKYKNPEVMPAWRVLRMATIEGARAIGLGGAVGSLEEGKQADFIAIDLRKPTMLPVYTTPMRNIVPNLVYSARGDEVALSAVDGKVIYRDGRVRTVDEEAIIDDVGKFVPDISRGASGEFWKIHGTNAEFMEKDRL